MITSALNSFAVLAKEKIRESFTLSLIKRFWALFLESFVFRFLRKIYRGIRTLCLESALGNFLKSRKDEGKIYETSFFAHVFDSLFSGISKFLHSVFNLLTFGTGDSLFLSFGRDLAKRFPWFDFTFITGISILFILLCPSGSWRNVFALVLGSVLFLIWIFKSAVKNEGALNLRSLGMPFLAFAFATLAGVGIAADRGEAMRVFSFFLSAFLLCAVIGASVKSGKQLQKLLGFVYFGVVFSAVIAIVQRIMGVEPNASLTDLELNRGMPGRVYSVFENPNNYAEIILMLYPVAAVYCLGLKEEYKRMLSAAGLLLPVIALLMTYSRSGWISFALIVVAFLFLREKRVLPVFFLLIFCMIPFLPASVFNRILTIGSTADSSNMYRLYIWGAVLDMLGDYGMIGLGLGPGNFRPVYLRYCVQRAAPATHSHMLYMEIWIEMGILGLLTFLVFYFSVLRKAVISRKGTSMSPVLTAAASSLVGLLFISAVEYIWYYPRVLFCFFILIGIIMAACGIAENEKSEACEKIKI